jgi:hypothetical protein
MTTATSKTIHCQRSGVPLVEVSTLCGNGWALLSQPVFSTFVHPTYGLSLSKLIKRLDMQLIEADKLEWELPPALVTEMGVTMSAIMYNLEVMWLPNEDALVTGKNIEQSLPDLKTTVGCAGRLLVLAGWYFSETSMRIQFPLWKPSKHAGNLNWHGFSAWLDACFDLREAWSQKKENNQREELLRSTEDSLKLVSQSQVYKRIDIKKVWNWVELQASQHKAKYPFGRRETFKSLFLTGETNPDLWTGDDCDDLLEMIVDTCDLGNDITSFIRARMTNIRVAIADFYGDFTLLGTNNPDGSSGLELSPTEQAAESKLFGEFENKLAGWSECPPKPNPADYPNRVAALKAQAEWNILSKLFIERAKRNTGASK